MRNRYFSDKDFRAIRVIAVVVGLLLHSLVIVGLFFYQERQAEKAKEEELLFGSSGGGGGEGQQDRVIQFGPQSPMQEGTIGQENTYKGRFNLIDIHVYSDLPNATPVVVREKPKPIGKPSKKRPTIIAENLPTRWVRRGTGPGSGGGAGGGSGGGIGKSTGYSIDWGGKGSRRLLSGRLPEYPEGTDKQMAVTLQFTVLADGSVDAVIPVRKTDEHLENAAIDALRTWRFDPLPDQMEPRPQSGKVSFNFKLEGIKQ